MGMFRRSVDAAVRHLTRTTDPVVKELRAARLSKAMERSPLLRHGARHFSQNDEDGILLEILSRIGLTSDACFVEFGVGDGLENNTLVLLAHGWRGAWIGGEKLAFSTEGTRVAFVLDWVTRENAVDLATGALKSLGRQPSDVRLVSMDLDGNDLYIVDALLKSGFDPNVLVVEYNAKFPPSAAFVMAYNAKHQWAGDDFFGASLKSYQDLLSERYRLVACNLSGANAFFVRQDHSASFADIPTSLNELYMPGPAALPYSGQRTSRLTVEQIIR